jgi:hydroxyethylthiazole kinase-like uncharacterized protein yjeF
MGALSIDVAGVAVGIDVTSVERVNALLARRPQLAERCFTAAEQRDCTGRPERWAARWAAKEAVRKLYGSLGRSPLPGFRDIEVRRGSNGVPSVRVGGAPATIALSLSHDAGIAAAVAVLAAPDPARRRLDRPPILPPPADLRLPERPADGHKGTFGTVCVVAGSHGFSGAAYLAAMGAARGGAGLVHLAVPHELHPILAVKCTEVMAHGLGDGGSGVLTEAGVDELRHGLLARAAALVVGPGLGRDPATRRALAALLRGVPCPVVVDADALNLAAEVGLDWRLAGRSVILTPHPAEMGRLAGLPTMEVQADRPGTAGGFAGAHAVVVVLKGARTVVAAPDGRLFTDAHQVVALATGGTGDVLAGLCGAFLAGGLEAFEAARAAVVVHAEAGVLVEAERGRSGALASDLLEALPVAQERVRLALEGR